MSHNFFRNEGQTDKLLELQDLELLATIDEVITYSRERVENNTMEEVATIHVSLKSVQKFVIKDEVRIDYISTSCIMVSNGHSIQSSTCLH